ncbi:MAG: GNAT family N-acetyltransferase [Planctomycetaceae bacterium]|nr:GNAT family N-acetyltransferase [Planctomycetaceae bacterium]
MLITIAHADIEQLDILVPLFDAYREFYGRPTECAAARAFLSKRLSNGDSHILLAVDEAGAGLGFAQLYPSFSSVAMQRVWILNDLFVVPEFRQHGIGRLLLLAAANVGKATDAVRIDLATAKDNFAAKSLYESIGYELDTAFDHYKFHIH